MKEIEKILFPSDLSSFSCSALEYAITFAKLYDATIYVLHVLDNSPYEMISRKSPEMDELYYRVEENARLEMNKCIRKNLEETVRIVQSIKSGDIKTEIINYAEEVDIDLIIMASHNIEGSIDLKSGSITNYIVNNTSIPVLSINKNNLISSQSSFNLTGNKFQLNTFGKFLFN